MRHFHELTVAGVYEETADSRRVLLDVPEALRDTFTFLPGQHVTVAMDTGDGEIRRSYSLCTAPGEWPLAIGVRVQPGGVFSGHVGERLKAGDTLQVMPPVGRFHLPADAVPGQRYAAFVAGSGITPVLSMLRSVLENDPAARFTLFYGNREQRSTMFIEDLFALKNRYPERLQLHFLFSREEQELPVAAGRLDGDKVAELLAAFYGESLPDHVFLCGPDSMIDDAGRALEAAGIDPAHIHAERFGAPRKARPDVAGEARDDAAEITVILDGHRRQFTMPAAEPNIVDAAAAKGIQLPYSCKGGVCATCRTFVAEGEVDMAVNYGLEPWEVEAGFVLACQCRPLSDRVVLDYDKT